MTAFIDTLGEGEKQIIKQLNNGNNTKQISIDITQKEFMTGFRKWREATSTSPSGRHLGHYKALLRAELVDNQPVQDNKKSKLKTINNIKGTEIFKSLYYVAMSALQAGETLDRWKQVQSSMLEKEPGKPLIHRLRVIHLYEADYNLVLKILWSRKVTWQAHKDGTLHESQAGSRPGRKAIDLVVFKAQKYLYSRLSLTPLLTMDTNDAKACYDRIICNLAMLTSQYNGMPENACKNITTNGVQIENSTRGFQKTLSTVYNNSSTRLRTGKLRITHTLVANKFHINGMFRHRGRRYEVISNRTKWKNNIVTYRWFCG